jgi:hypothetical protein
MKQNGKSRRRLSNQELEFLENIAAAACGIIINIEALADWMDEDQEQIDRGIDIKREALSIRKAALEWKEKRRARRDV